ncbi:MAG: DUF2071 domain-containing protein [Bacteroidetes bacterium]|nr:DUF2071 domain-containing protein [Bacteroidota bacterium]
MKIPTIHGYIDRRILINYVGDPEVVSHYVPAPFRPQIYNGKAIIGVCLIRLKHIKVKGLPNFVGISSENAAHRIAVEWDENGETRQGVYIPRRDTSLWFNALVGGRVFPGRHYLARFDVKETAAHYDIHVSSSDQTAISIEADIAPDLDSTSIFGSLDSASEFFEKGCIGYSPDGKSFDGLKLALKEWKVTPLNVKKAHSGFFENESIFPKGSVSFDHALLMNNVEHEWHGIGRLRF